MLVFNFIKKIFHAHPSSNAINKNNFALTNIHLHKNLDKNIALLKEVLGSSMDIIYSKIYLGEQRQLKGTIIYVNGMVNKDIINESIFKPILVYGHKEKTSDFNYDIQIFGEYFLSTGHTESSNDLVKLTNSVLYGDTLLLLDGFSDALIINTKKWDKRSISEPQTNVTIRGPREGFTETIKVNMSMLRRKIVHPNLRFEDFKIGNNTNTSVVMAYFKGIAHSNLVEEVRDRLYAIDTDEILDSGYIEELIEDHKYSLFPMVDYTERPDTLASKVLEGKVAIFVDGTPCVLTVPALFVEHFQSAEDYYARPFYSSFIRMIRFFSYTISILAPSIYITLVSFHQELIPTPLLISMAKARESVPFPSVLESLVMIVTFEILKEAGIRLPRPIGQTISIVGALVLGEAAVSAGLIGEPMVIVISITAISSFIIPTLNDSIVFLRFMFLGLSATLGAFGILIGAIIVLIHLASLKSFHTPYLYPIAPFNFNDLKDVFIRKHFKSKKNIRRYPNK